MISFVLSFHVTHSSSIDTLFSISQNICQGLTHFISIGQNLHKLEYQRARGVLTDTDTATVLCDHLFYDYFLQTRGRPDPPPLDQLLQPLALDATITSFLRDT